MQTLLWLFVWTYSLGSKKEVRTRSNMSFIISPLWNHMARVENFPFWLKLVLLLLFKMQIVFLKQRKFSKNLHCNILFPKNTREKLRLKKNAISVWRIKQPQYYASSNYAWFTCMFYWWFQTFNLMIRILMKICNESALRTSNKKYLKCWILRYRPILKYIMWDEMQVSIRENF